MDEYKNEKHLSNILKATCDATRRSLLTTLVQEGPLRVTELAAHYDMSLNAISKHIKVLESAKLVSRTTLGRVHLIKAELAPIQQIDNWFKNLRSIWDLRLDNLAAVLKKELNDE